jgi:AraC family transcriptional regulator
MQTNLLLEIDPPVRRHWSPSLPESVNDVAASLIALLKSARNSFDKDKEGAKSSLAEACSLLQIAIERDASERLVTSGGLASWQIKRLNGYLEEHIDQSIRVEDLSKVVGLSCNYFSRAFKRSFGQTPHDYITRRRVELASHILLTTDRALTDVALACGFSDQAHLCRQFRQHFGVTPGTWRRERRDRCRPIAQAAGLAFAEA